MKIISNEKQLNDFLKKIIKNTVKQSILSEDKYKDSFLKVSKAEMSDLINDFDEKSKNMSLDEDEEPAEEPEEESEPAEEPAEESEPAEEPEEESKKNPAAEKAISLGNFSDNTEPTFQGLKDAINVLRAGRSLKDKDISNELNDYFDILDKDEKSVLILFLRELSKIVTGAIEGEEAEDPFSPKTHFKITKNASSKNVSNDADKNKNIEVPSQKSISASDTTPPIRVNENQDLSMLRKIKG